MSARDVAMLRPSRLLVAQAQPRPAPGGAGSADESQSEFSDTPEEVPPDPDADAGADTKAGTGLELECLAMLRRREYDEVVDRIAPLLRQPQSMTPCLHYVYGVALRLLGDLEDAEPELTALGDYRPTLETRRRIAWRPASTVVADIKQRLRLFPRYMEPVKVGDTIRFHVYYDGMNDWARTWVATLPRAYAANRQLLGRDFAPITILLFNDYESFAQCAANGRPGVRPPLYARALGNSACVLVSRYNGRGQDAPVLPLIYHSATMTHEMNHHLVARMIGLFGLPRWFMEGLAMTLEDQVQPALDTQRGRQVRQIVLQDGILSLDDLTRNFDRTVKGLTGEDPAAAAKWRNSSAYAQSFSMVDYFLHKLKPGDLTRFLHGIRDTRNHNPHMSTQAVLDDQFKTYGGEPIDDFYADWLHVVSEIKKH